MGKHKSKSTSAISVLFLDIGGLLLTNGWDRGMRRRAADEFGLDFDEMNERHNLTFDTYERGLLRLDEYLSRVVFYQTRAFTPERFKRYMFDQSQPLDGSIEAFRGIADTYGLKVVAISNEGRELATHRIRQFRLTEFIDVFILSSFVRFRKPDEDIYRLALDIAQVSPEHAVYVDDRLLFVEVARGLGIHSIYHEKLDRTLEMLGQIGLRPP